MWNELQPILRNLYKEKGVMERFNADARYLNAAFDGIEEKWMQNLNKIDKVNYVLFAEAPLWGAQQKYIYNPMTLNSQFFHRSDLADALNIRAIVTKERFLEIFNSIGLLVVDISPFAFNPVDTILHYRNVIKGPTYRTLLERTFPIYLQHKLEKVQEKIVAPPIFMTRYKRVHDGFSDLLIDIVQRNQLADDQPNLVYIGQIGGGIHKPTLRSTINPNGLQFAI